MKKTKTQRRIAVSKGMHKAKTGTITKAVMKYLGFHDKDSFKITKDKIVIPKEMIHIGSVPEITYKSDKWDGKMRAYVHHLKTHGNLILGLNKQGRVNIAIITGLNMDIKPEGLTG